MHSTLDCQIKTLRAYWSECAHFLDFCENAGPPHLRPWKHSSHSRRSTPSSGGSTWSKRHTKWRGSRTPAPTSTWVSPSGAFAEQSQIGRDKPSASAATCWNGWLPPSQTPSKAFATAPSSQSASTSRRGSMNWHRSGLKTWNCKLMAPGVA